MRNVLILHHLEPMWESGYKKKGTSFDRMCEKVIDHLNDHLYNQIILTRFEDTKLDVRHYESGLGEMRIDVYEYGYGWDAAQIVDYPEDFVEGGTHSEAVMISDWMRDLPKRGGVYLAGAFDGECIEDMEIALRALKVKFTRVEELIV